MINSDRYKHLIQPRKTSDQQIIELEKRAARAERFGPIHNAGPSATKPSILPNRPSAPVSGKRKATESLEEARVRKGRDMETRDSIEKDFLRARHRAELLREKETIFRAEAEEEEERMRRLKLQLEELDR